MAPPDRDVLRELAAWDPGGLPVTTLYLDTDGRRYPRRAMFLTRAQDLLRSVRDRAEGLDRQAWRSVCSDSARIETFLREEFDRRGTRGTAVFSSSGAGLWRAVALAQPVRDRATAGPRPHLVPLEAVLERAETMCTAIVDREKARVLVSALGEVEEVSHILDDVPGQHDQGGWSQARLQRHIEDHVQRHLKHVAGSLLRLQQERGFDHLVLAGPGEILADLERELHDYLRRAIVARVHLPMTVSATEVLERTMDVERELEQRREREAVERLGAETASGNGRAVSGVRDTVAALESGRVETLVVTTGLQASGVRCPSCGHLDAEGPRCAACGSEVEAVPDLVEEAVEAALRQRCRVETVADAPAMERLGGIGALLRF